MLKGKFTEGVREEFLRRELRSINVQYPDLEFWELRDRAIQWLGDDTESLSGARTRTAPANTAIGFAVRADFRRLYPANAKTSTCCPSDDNRTKVTNSVTSARSLWWHVGPYFWPADLTRTANPIQQTKTETTEDSQGNMTNMLEILRKQQDQIHGLVKAMATLKQNGSAGATTDRQKRDVAPTWYQGDSPAE